MSIHYGNNLKGRKGDILIPYTPAHIVARSERGFTLIEFLVTFAILILVGGAIYTVQRDLFSFNAFFGDALAVERDIAELMTQLTAEIREATQASTGAYPIAIAESNSFAFYADIDGDSIRERIHYFRDDTSLKRSVVRPAGQPLTYATSTAEESVRVVLRNVVASSTAPLFSYYDGTYAGTSTPLVVPVATGVVRHVRITITVDADPARLPPAVSVRSHVSMRNLKDTY